MVISRIRSRLMRKGMNDTIGCGWSIISGLADYYLNPWSRKKKNLQSLDHKKIVEDLRSAGIDVVPYKVDVGEFNKWLNKFTFPNTYVSSYGSIFKEKALEHYVGLRLLELNKDDVLIDIGGADSPWYEMAESQIGCKGYSLDLTHPAGIIGRKIGADATKMPLLDSFASKMSLHCAYETFEGDADCRLIPEAYRILTPKGRMVILPLYMHHVYFADSSPWADRRKLDLQGAVRYWRNDRYNIRFSRKYSPEQVVKRVLTNWKGSKTTVFYIENEKDIDPACYLKFAAVFYK